MSERKVTTKTQKSILKLEEIGDNIFAFTKISMVDKKNCS